MSSFIAVPFAIKMMLSYALVRQILPCRTSIYTDTPIKVIRLGCKIYLLYKEVPGNTALCTIWEGSCRHALHTTDRPNDSESGSYSSSAFSNTCWLYDSYSNIRNLCIPCTEAIVLNVRYLQLRSRFQNSRCSLGHDHRFVPWKMPAMCWATQREDDTQMRENSVFPAEVRYAEAFIVKAIIQINL